MPGRQKNVYKCNLANLLLSELDALPRFLRSRSRPRELRLLSLSESGDAIDNQDFLVAGKNGIVASKQWR